MASNSQHHIVMLPFMGQGHLIPFLALARKFQETAAFKLITIASTPLNLQYLRSAIVAQGLEEQSSGIRLAALPFNPTDHGLPPNGENTEALALKDIGQLFTASTSLESPFRDLVSEITAEEGKPPVCIISDIFMGWANRVAEWVGSVSVNFCTGGCYGYAAYVSFWVHLPHRSAKENDGEFAMPGFPESTRFHTSQLHPFMRAGNGSDSWSLFFRQNLALSNSFGWLCNTVQEIEPTGFQVLRNISKSPVWCIGPLLPPGMLKTSPVSGLIGRNSGREPGLSPEKCIEWLNKHPEGSVLYISFGSQNTISASQMMALALGLEDSQKPFLWVIRPPIGFDIKGEFRPEWLPEGFEERMGKNQQGKVVHSWAPQLEILCHRSVGAFLSHCGWNSVMESLSQGIPLIGWPLAAEQGFNSKMLMEEMGVSVELCRGSQSSISREEVKSVVDRVLDKEGKGKEMKNKAVQIKELIRSALKEDGAKGSSVRAMDDFVTTILGRTNV
ncbi:PREDICTED: UDP-glycosyltransferase 92A1-like [Ipomoea nil]|uniref:UDP-glycosyltransferase 92A1-like n=1 Tax=Ipomoea nil TaxID=35883 RepID=UPI000900CF7D|nr:PREDICTED: UDP-glycosyltransferase 92A1-like [Ipomoea nil]